MKKLITLIIFISTFSRLAAQDSLQIERVKNQYLAEQKILGKKFSNAFYPYYVRMHQLSEKAFAVKIDSAAKGFYSLLDTYKSKLPEVYIAAQQFEIKMYFDKILIEYPQNHEIYTNEHPKSYPIIDGKVKSDRQLFNDPSLLDNSDLMPFIRSFLGYKINAELNNPIYKGLYNKRLYAMWNLLPKYITNQQCINYHRYHLLSDHITHNGVKQTIKLYQAFKKQCRDSSFIAKLEEVYRNSYNDLKDHQVREYKRIGTYGLDIHIFQNGLAGNTKKPAIVFFHGGSWSEGQASWHFEACRKYAEKGWIACSVEYRIYGSQGTLPFSAVMDARSAIRWLREHGTELNIDTGRIVATGNSAGGHLVLATALANGWNEKSDHLKFSPVPNVLLVNSGVYDLTDEKTAWIRKDLKNKDLTKGISPNNLVKPHLPPMLLVHSASDQNVPYPSVQKFAALMTAAGNIFELKTLEQGGHFIFDHPAYTPTVFAWRKEFLKSLGYPDNDGE
ncbi:alpha/beta hydrolase [Mucilaginibacter sp. UYCu711]|uniref:alpha/beta hydrolase n=1 Tax=Mucilaginibacter sp. UYCu711 TaxID=3156339 RepID=UPI003D1EF6E4